MQYKLTGMKKENIHKLNYKTQQTNKEQNVQQQYNKSNHNIYLPSRHVVLLTSCCCCLSHEVASIVVPPTSFYSSTQELKKKYPNEKEKVEWDCRWLLLAVVVR